MKSLNFERRTGAIGAACRMIDAPADGNKMVRTFSLREDPGSKLRGLKASQLRALNAARLVSGMGRKLPLGR